MDWREAKKSAWKQFGRRYWKLIVGVEMAKKFGPGILAGLTVAALAAGVWWLVSHAPAIDPGMPSVDVPGSWWWWPIGLGIVGAALVLVFRRRDPLTPRRPAAVFARVVAVLAAAGAVLLLLVTRDA